jgi:hypothetical protein
MEAAGHVGMQLQLLHPDTATDARIRYFQG